MTLSISHVGNYGIIAYFSDAGSSVSTAGTHRSCPFVNVNGSRPLRHALMPTLSETKVELELGPYEDCPCKAILLRV